MKKQYKARDRNKNTNSDKRTEATTYRERRKEQRGEK